MFKKNKYSPYYDKFFKVVKRDHNPYIIISDQNKWLAQIKM